MKKLLLLPLLLVLLTACLDEIDLTQGDALPEGIVLQGRINLDSNDNEAEARITLERLFNFADSNRPDRVANATVTLENSEGQTINLPFRDGAYRAEIPLNAGFRVAPGLGYKVVVTTREGENYETAFDVMPEPIALERVEASIGVAPRLNAIGTEVMDTAVFYNVTGPVRYPNGEPSYIRWTTNQTYKVTDTPMHFSVRDNEPKVCYITQGFMGANINLYQSQNSSVSRVEDFPITFQFVDFPYAEGNVMTIFQEAISQEAFIYFDQIGKIASTDASIFEPPGGPVIGNARDVNGNTSNVFGFFYAANRSSVRVAVAPEEVGFPTPFCPRPPSQSPTPSFNSCDDCLIINGSELSRPSWFPF
ncbi:MAG: DUF4249 family protein [Bacteroidota bacterium]